MIPIIFFGKSTKNDKLSKAVRTVLSKYGGFQSIKYTSNNGLFLYSSCANPKFFIYDTLSNILFSNIPSGIIILRNNIPLKSHIFMQNMKNSVIIINENNRRINNTPGNMRCSIVSCGMAQSNTLSISSVKYNRAFISLQQKITTLSGEVVDPHDFPVTFSGEGAFYPLLVCCAVLICSGFDSSKGFFF